MREKGVSLLELMAVVAIIMTASTRLVEPVQFHTNCPAESAATKDGSRWRAEALGRGTTLTRMQ